MKTPAATAMVGAQTKINNQLKSVTASESAAMTGTKMTMDRHRRAATAVAMKTPAATAIVGAQTQINNQLKSATASELTTMTATKMTMGSKATAAAAVALAARRRHSQRQRGCGIPAVA